jgi:hypothetical protein
MRCKRVPQLVRRGQGQYASPYGVPAHELPEAFASEWAPTGRQKQNRWHLDTCLGTNDVEVVADVRQRDLAHRNEAPFATLSASPDDAALSIQIGDGQGA